MKNKEIELDLKLHKYDCRAIKVESSANGYILHLFFATFTYSDKDDLLHDLNLYLVNPEKFYKYYNQET